MEPPIWNIVETMMILFPKHMHRKEERVGNLSLSPPHSRSRAKPHSTQKKDKGPPHPSKTTQSRTHHPTRSVQGKRSWCLADEGPTTPPGSKRSQSFQMKIRKPRVRSDQISPLTYTLFMGRSRPRGNGSDSSVSAIV